MRQSKFTETQIVAMLKEADAGRSARSACGSTTKSGPMTPWRGCHRRRFGPRSSSEILLSDCPLDGEAYALCTAIERLISILY